MNKNEIREKVCAAVDNSEGAVIGANIRDNDYLKNDLGMDCLDIVEMVMSLEQDLSICISNSEMDVIAGMTVGELIGFLGGKVNG